MAKPILIIKLPDVEQIKITEVKQSLLLHPISKEYHLLIINCKQENPTIECFNDCKGLADADIEELINSIKCL